MFTMFEAELVHRCVTETFGCLIRDPTFVGKIYVPPEIFYQHAWQEKEQK